MTYDNQARLASWTAPSGTSANEQFLYDNEGNRVLQRTVSTIGSTTTVDDTITFDGYTQTSITNGSTTTTKYYSAAGQTVAMTVGGTWYALVGDGLGSTALALKGDGTVQAVQLYAPFGSVRSTDGTMPTRRTYTGQVLDEASGLLYDNARYYDPQVGNFTSADRVQQNAQGMNPYLYVAGNPETKTDPSRQRVCPGGSFEQCAGGPPYGGEGGSSGGGGSDFGAQIAEAMANGTFYHHASSSGCGVTYAECFLLGTQVETSHVVHVSAPALPTEGRGIFCTGLFCGIGAAPGASPQTGIDVIASSVSAVPMCWSLQSCLTKGGEGGEGSQEEGGDSDFGNIKFALEGDVSAGGGGSIGESGGISFTGGETPSGNNAYAQVGNAFHYDQLNGGPPGSVGGPSQLQQIYPRTEFRFALRGASGADVEVTGGIHPSDASVYLFTNWPEWSDFGDFKPDTPRGYREFLHEISNGKLPSETVPIWYDRQNFIISGIGW